MSIIYIPKKTNEAFKGANTIEVKDFIELINKVILMSSSEHPCTSSELNHYKIIRKVIESENKNLALLSAIRVGWLTTISRFKNSDHRCLKHA